MNKQERKNAIKQATLKHYRETVTNIRRVVLKNHLDDVDTVLMLRACLDIKLTKHAHHFNGGVVYINQEMFERLSIHEQVKILTKKALHCAAWMENRLNTKPHLKTRLAHRELVQPVAALSSRKRKGVVYKNWAV